MAESQENRILILAEKENGRIAYLTYELLEAGKGLARKTGTKFCVAVLGDDVSGPSEEMVRFADEVYVLEHPLLANFQSEFYAHALETLCRDMTPDTILMGHTLDNLDLAPRLACRIRASLITDSIRLDIGAGGELLCDKPIYGDNAMATFVVEKRPRMVTLRPKAMGAIKAGPDRGKVIHFNVTLEKSLAKTESLEAVAGESVNLDKADAIVAGGRGIKEVEGLGKLQELVETLKRYFSKVEVGASRPLIDQGWLPSSRQIGLTGEKVAPDLYIGIGISGASQHLSGMMGSKKIIAINKDEEALIFSAADYGVVGRYEEVLPGLIGKLGELP